MVTRVSGEASTHHASGGRHSDAAPVALRRMRTTTKSARPSHGFRQPNSNLTQRVRLGLNKRRSWFLFFHLA